MKHVSLDRRTMLGASLGTFAAAALAGCGGSGPAVARDAAVGPVPDSGLADAGLEPDAGFEPDAGAADAGAADAGACEVTPADAKGPFHRPGAPSRTALASELEPGDRLEITGVVLGPDCGAPLAGALLDVWQADAAGRYDTLSADYRLRAIMMTDQDGRFGFTTVRPGNYPDANGIRPAHIHFTVSHPGYSPVTTQMYFRGDPYLAPVDSCRGCSSDEPSLIVALTEEDRGGVRWLTGHFRIVLAR